MGTLKFYGRCLAFCQLFYVSLFYRWVHENCFFGDCFCTLSWRRVKVQSFWFMDILWVRHRALLRMDNNQFVVKQLMSGFWTEQQLLYNMCWVRCSSHCFCFLKWFDIEFACLKIELKNQGCGQQRDKCISIEISCIKYILIRLFVSLIEYHIMVHLWKLRFLQR